MAKITCTKCGRTKDELLFYTLPGGKKFELCKDCTLMHVNIWQPDSFVWLLEKFDVPWLPWEWQTLRQKSYAKNPNKKNDTAVFGKYLSIMKLKQHRNDRWADTERLTAQHQKELKAKEEENQAMQDILTQQFKQGIITESQYRTLADSDAQKSLDNALELAAAVNGVNKKSKPKTATEALTQVVSAIGDNNFYNEKNFIDEGSIPDLTKDLTEEDKKYLVMKWGRYYTPQEWVQLETFYNQMMNSFDIQDADTRSTLILICKNNLKMNQAIDQGDLEGYQKLARVSDQLRKSAKFTAAQNKDKDNQFIDSVGQLVAYCQRHGGEIPRIDVSVKRDIIDQVIADLKEYTKSLVYEDPALKRQVEEYLKKLKSNEQHKKDQKEAKEQGLDYVPISDEDIRAYNEQIKSQKEEDLYMTQDAFNQWFKGGNSEDESGETPLD